MNESTLVHFAHVRQTKCTGQTAAVHERHPQLQQLLEYKSRTIMFYLSLTTSNTMLLVLVSKYMYHQQTGQHFSTWQPMNSRNVDRWQHVAYVNSFVKASSMQMIAIQCTLPPYQRRCRPPAISDHTMYTTDKNVPTHEAGVEMRCWGSQLLTLISPHDCYRYVIRSCRYYLQMIQMVANSAHDVNTAAIAKG